MPNISRNGVIGASCDWPSRSGLIGIACPRSTNQVNRLALCGIERIHAIDRERDQSRSALSTYHAGTAPPIATSHSIQASRIDQHAMTVPRQASHPNGAQANRSPKSFRPTSRTGSVQIRRSSAYIKTPATRTPRTMDTGSWSITCSPYPRSSRNCEPPLYSKNMISRIYHKSPEIASRGACERAWSIGLIPGACESIGSH